MPTEPELLTRLNEHVTAVEAIYAKSDDDGGKLTDDDRRKLDEYEKSIDDIERQVKDLRARAQNDERHERLNGKPTSMIRFPNAPGAGSNGTAAKSETRASIEVVRKSMGELFASSDEYREWFKSAAPGGQLPQRGRISSPPVEAKELLDWVIRKGLLTSVNMEPLISPDDMGLIPYQWAPLPIFSVITNGTTTSDTIEFARITGYENNAAPVPEATDVTGTSGLKPMSNMTVEAESVTVKTIAHWIPATKRVLADIAQLRSIIDAFLREGLRQQLAYQILNGDGTGENFLGILATPGLGGPVAAGTDALAAIRRARTLVQYIGRATPNAILMNPVNWEALDTLQMQTGQFFFGGPMSMGTARLWGLPVIEDEAIPVGTALVGDFRQVILWNRQQATISATDSHADFFIRNLVAILGELRAAFAVMQPGAIVRVTGLPGTALPTAPVTPPDDFSAQGAHPAAAAPASSAAPQARQPRA